MARGRPPGCPVAGDDVWAGSGRTPLTVSCRLRPGRVLLGRSRGLDLRTATAGRCPLCRTGLAGTRRRPAASPRRRVKLRRAPTLGRAAVRGPDFRPSAAFGFRTPSGRCLDGVSGPPTSNAGPDRSTPRRELVTSDRRRSRASTRLSRRSPLHGFRLHSRRRRGRGRHARRPLDAELAPGQTVYCRRIGSLHRPCCPRTRQLLPGGPRAAVLGRSTSTPTGSRGRRRPSLALVVHGRADYAGVQATSTRTAAPGAGRPAELGRFAARARGAARGYHPGSTEQEVVRSRRRRWDTWVRAGSTSRLERGRPPATAFPRALSWMPASAAAQLRSRTPMPWSPPATPPGWGRLCPRAPRRRRSCGLSPTRGRRCPCGAPPPPAARSRLRRFRPLAGRSPWRSVPVGIGAPYAHVPAPLGVGPDSAPRCALPWLRKALRVMRTALPRCPSMRPPTPWPRRSTALRRPHEAPCGTRRAGVRVVVLRSTAPRASRESS